MTSLAVRTILGKAAEATTKCPTHTNESLSAALVGPAVVLACCAARGLSGRRAGGRGCGRSGGWAVGASVGRAADAATKCHKHAHRLLMPVVGQTLRKHSPESLGSHPPGALLFSEVFARRAPMSTKWCHKLANFGPKLGLIWAQGWRRALCPPHWPTLDNLWPGSVELGGRRAKRA